MKRLLTTAAVLAFTTTSAFAFDVGMGLIGRPNIKTITLVPTITMFSSKINGRILWY